MMKQEKQDSWKHRKWKNLISRFPQKDVLLRNSVHDRVAQDLNSARESASQGASFEPTLRPLTSLSADIPHKAPPRAKALRIRSIDAKKIPQARKNPTLASPYLSSFLSHWIPPSLVLARLFLLFHSIFQKKSGLLKPDWRKWNLNWILQKTTSRERREGESLQTRGFLMTQKFDFFEIEQSSSYQSYRKVYQQSSPSIPTNVTEYTNTRHSLLFSQG